MPRRPKPGPADPHPENRTVAPWVVRLSPDFLDHRITSLSDRAHRVMVVLDSFARTQAYCFPSNATLAAITDRHERKVKEVLAELESTLWIKRVHGPRMERIGIILLRRVGPGTPAADTPERLAAAEAALRGGRNRPTEKPQCAEIGTPGMPETAPPSVPISAPELGLEGEQRLIDNDNNPPLPPSHDGVPPREDGGEDPALAEALALAAKLWGSVAGVEESVRDAAREFTAAWVVRALELAGGKESVGWGWVLDKLRRFRAKGHPEPGRSKSRTKRQGEAMDDAFRNLYGEPQRAPDDPRKPTLKPKPAVPYQPPPREPPMTAEQHPDFRKRLGIPGIDLSKIGKLPQ